MTTLAPLDQQGPNLLLKKIHRGVSRVENRGYAAHQGSKPHDNGQKTTR
jgi:hypothetical protein